MRFLLGILLLSGMRSVSWAQGAAAPSVAPANLPNTSILPSKRIHPNDLVGITVFEEPDLTRTVRVDPEGLIRLPMLKDQIKADGLMPEELEKTIAAELKNERIMVDPFVTVTVAEYYRPPRAAISVVGAVRTPVTFQSVEPVTLIEAITRAGGIAPEAGSEILISIAGLEDPADKRTDGTSDTGAKPDGTSALVKRVRVKSLVDATDPSGNLILTGGETIRVPEAGHIYVFGNVKNPGTLPVSDSSDATVFKAIALSQGFAPYAAKQGYIFRREAGSSSRNEIPVDLRRIVDHKAPDVQLMANDILYVPDATSRRNTVSALKVLSAIGTILLSAVIYLSLR